MSSWNPDLIPDGPDDVDADSPGHAMFCDCIECQAADAEEQLLEERWTLAEEGIAHEDDVIIDLGELERICREAPPA